MRKRDELDYTTSCINQSGDDEVVFVLCARDPAAPAAIRAWAAERIRLGKNASDDMKILEAEECAVLMEKQFSDEIPGVKRRK